MSDDHDDGDVDPDRAAILARRRGFLARALDGLGPVGMAGAAVVVAASGITAACGIAQACLSMYIPPDDTGESGTESETGSESETDGSEETDGTETGATG